MPVGAAIGVSGALGAGASIYGASQASDASSNALKQQQANSDKAWSSVNPFITAGTDALSKLQTPATSFQASPGYQFALDQGENAVTQNKAVNGLLKSGSALKAVGNYAQGQADQQYNNWWTQQAGLASQGISAAGVGAGVTAGANANIGTNAANQGNASISTTNSLGNLSGSALTSFLSQYGSPASGSSYSANDPSAVASEAAPVSETAGLW